MVDLLPLFSIVLNYHKHLRLTKRRQLMHHAPDALLPFPPPHPQILYLSWDSHGDELRRRVRMGENGQDSRG